MNKIAKICAVAFVLGAFASSIVTTSNKANATMASVTLTGGTDVACTLSDYVWTGLTASASNQSLTEKTNDIVCTWGTNPKKTVKIQLGNLTATEGSIPASGFTGNLNATKSTSGSLTGGMATVASAVNLGSQQTVFTKALNKIGTYTGSIGIKGTVPGGTPAGLYTGAINITQS